MTNARPAAPAQENKERQRLFVEVLQDQGRLDRVDEFVSPDFVNHSRPPGSPDGPEGVRAIFAAIRQGFPTTTRPSSR